MRLDDLHRAVQSTLSSKRLGTPVFVRYLVQGPVAGKALPAFLARLANTISGWMSQDLERIYAIGSIKSRHVSLTLQYREGGCGQLTWAGGAARGPGVDLMLLGNRGALYHDFGLTNLWEGPAFGPVDKENPELAAWIDRALRSGQPEGAEK